MARPVFARLVLLILAAAVSAVAAAMPLPWTRELSYSSESVPLSGQDVSITQFLLLRDASTPANLAVDGVFSESTALAVKSFQSAHSLAATGVLDSVTAQSLLDLHYRDKVTDSGFTAASLGYLYKLHIPVYANRSVESKATLFDSQNNVMHVFTVRAHGHRDNDEGTAPWPDFGSTPGDVGLSQFAGSGDTTTGIIEVDLNSAEPSPSMYGPWPVNRLVRGLDGNAKFLLPDIRDGQLLHTGNWSTVEQAWDSSMDMPNSSGCLHAHPEDVERVFKILTTQLGVVVNENPFSGKNYPFKPQGIAVIEQLD